MARRIVGFTARRAHAPRQSLATDAVQMALAARDQTGELVAHSDDGLHYTSFDYTEQPKKAAIALSRGRTGTALDNAMAASVISTIKRGLTKRHTWRTGLDLELASVVFIGFNNRHRLYRFVCGRQPLEPLDEYCQEQQETRVTSE